ncbi:MAG: hypothetical protein ABSF12_23495, partial [Bryobacteraceae bacterium]
MKFLKSLLMGTGGVVLAGLILALLAPRAVHAVVATAVQVVNTSASPAITQSIGNQAAQIVQIECGILPGSAIEFPGTSLNVGCVAVPPAGFNFDVPPPANSQYTVPAGETLVVTSVDI